MVIVINDVTRLRRLENVRKEFVANVSHELKTPITSIKGFVETLRDGAVNHPIDSGRFLDIIATQIERMKSIVEDLLLLSQFEQENGVADSRLEEHPLKSVIDEALMICGWKADEKNVTVDVTCSEDITALINPALLEQALVNLIDNAIKYSDPGGVVDVRAVEEGAEVVVGVRDEGCGIDPEHGERLFERFYRVDRARSRKLGGTGLGLAIVKHIMIAHKGSVSFESTPGAGSTFYIRLRAEA